MGVNRFYLIIPAAAFLAFLTFYIPDRYSRRAAFLLEGPGQIQEFRSVARISWNEGKSRGKLDNPVVVQRIAAAIGTEFGDWKEQSITWKPGFLPVRFHDADSPRYVTFHLGPNFAVQGKYFRFLPAATVTAIRKELEANSIVRIRNEDRWGD